MNQYSATSLHKLQTCHPYIQKLMFAVLEDDDNTIIFGHRPKQLQFELFQKGRKLVGDIWVVSDKSLVVTNCDGYKIASYHNYEKGGELCSLAIDVAPYANGRMLTDDKSVCYFAGKVMRRAQEMGIPLKWGGDWDGDQDTKDQTFHDLVHFELKGIA
jgi:peptidoglycan L-alanyl-D-glutamate endopeptidase CwlK